MSDNLKVAKECGATVLEDGCIIFHHSTQLDKYTSRILASQQAAHDAEIAKLKEELREEEEVYNCTNKALNHVVDELSTANERIAYLEGLVAVQDAAIQEADAVIRDYKINPVTMNGLKTFNEAISASAETVQAFRDKLTDPLRRDVAMLCSTVMANHQWHTEYDEYGGYPDSEICEKNLSAINNTQSTAQAYEQEVEARGAVKALEDFGEPFKFSYPWIYNECKKKAEERRATSNKAGTTIHDQIAAAKAELATWPDTVKRATDINGLS